MSISTLHEIEQTAAAYWQKAVQKFTLFSNETGMPLPIDLVKSETNHQIKKLKLLFDNSKKNIN